MEISLDRKELEKALKDIKKAEGSGFMFCRGVFSVVGMNGAIGIAEYSDIWEKAHPTDGHLDWGRFQNVHQRKRFVNGRLEPK